MPNRPILGPGPVPLTAGDKFYLVPLTDLSVTPTGGIDSSPWRAKNGMADGSKGQKALDGLLTALVARETLKPTQAPAAGPGQALVFRAAREGEAGNNTVVTISKVEPDVATPADSKLDLTVVESVEFQGLSTKQADAKFVGKVLDPAESPWLVELQAALAADVEYPAPGKHEPAGGAAEIKVPQKADAAKTSFVVVDADGAAGPATSVVVTATDEAANVFALTATRTTTKAGAKLSGLVTAGSADANAVKHAVIVEAPVGKSAALPEVGDYKLAGGSGEVTVPAAKSMAVAFTEG